MSTFNSRISNFLTHAMGFGARDEPQDRSKRQRYSSMHQRDCEDANAITFRKGESARPKRRKERFDFFDG